MLYLSGPSSVGSRDSTIREVLRSRYPQHVDNSYRCLMDDKAAFMDTTNQSYGGEAIRPGQPTAHALQ